MSCLYNFTIIITFSAFICSKYFYSLELQNPNTKERILHSDLGSQYTSNKFDKYLEELSIKHSYSKKGYLYYNAPMEYFHSCFKKEDERMNKYIDFNDAKISTFQYIESCMTEKEFIVEWIYDSTSL